MFCTSTTGCSDSSKSFWYHYFQVCTTEYQTFERKPGQEKYFFQKVWFRLTFLKKQTKQLYF